MKTSLKLAGLLFAALAIAACNSGGTSNVPAPAGASGGASAASRHIPEWKAKHEARAMCPQVVGKPTCLVLLVEKNGIVPPCSPSSSCGFTPQQLEAAYGLTDRLRKGSGTKVALIETGDLPRASKDLATYRKQYGLGKAKVVRYNEYGQQYNYPPSCESSSYGFCLEADLDMDMVAAACPKCTIFMVEANVTGISDLETAEAEAVTLGATIISNSWVCIGSWDCHDPNFANYFDTPGVAYLASSGDSGYPGIGAPSVLDSVIAVGGTQLEQSGSTYSESVWADAGAGCASPSYVGSPGVSKPSWQHDPDCTYRTDSDISAEAGCTPGVAMYDGGYNGWTEECGTSASSPFVAGVIGLAGNASSQNGGQDFWQLKVRERRRGLHAVTSGNDGHCMNTYLCTAGTKQFGTYSGPAGWGTPKGIKDF